MQTHQFYRPAPELQLIYDSAPVGLAFLSTDCRYVQINQRLTEICGMSVADHLGRSVRETVPQVADEVEKIVETIMRTREPVLGVEVRGQRPDNVNADRFWMTYWHPLKTSDGDVIGINVAAEEITERKRAEAALNAHREALHESELRFRDLAENISQFAWTADQSGWIYWFNKRWYDYTGTTLDEMQGWGWQKVHHPDHVERVVLRIRDSFENGIPWEDTFPLRGRDGGYRWFLSRALPIRNEAGEVIRWFGTNTDVTKQIEAEQALRELNETLELRVEDEARERLRTWNVSQDLLMVADIKGKYLSVNPAWTASLDWSESDLLGRSSQWLLHPDDRVKTEEEIRHLAAGGRTLHFENRLRHKDGSYRWISWKATPDQGRIYATGRDVTELRNAEHLLRNAQQELALAARRTMLAAMTASIAHEINQPLAAICANGGAGLRWLTRSEPDLEEARAALRRIVDDGNRASNVIASVRAMFRKDRQEQELLDLNALVRDVLALVKGEFDSRRIVLQAEFHESIPRVSGERGPLQQVLLNLFLNAVEAMSLVTDRMPLLSVRTEINDSRFVLVTVADNGPGIEPETMAQIFDAFFTTKAEGMGMGLSICRSIVEAHGGRLWAARNLPEGTAFHVQLPAAS